MVDQPVTAQSPSSQISVELSSRNTGMAFQRTRLSAERTLMSVIRTALSLISFGFTITQFFVHLKTENLPAEFQRSTAAVRDQPRHFGCNDPRIRHLVSCGFYAGSAEGAAPDDRTGAHSRRKPVSGLGYLYRRSALAPGRAADDREHDIPHRAIRVNAVGPTDGRAIGVNTHGSLDPAMPFGGFKQSGWGREKGREVLELYTEVKSVGWRCERVPSIAASTRPACGQWSVEVGACHRAHMLPVLRKAER